MTPGVQSGLNSPLGPLSRSGSSENLAAHGQGVAVPPAALSSRLQAHASRDDGNRISSYFPIITSSGSPTQHHHHSQDNDHTSDWSQPHSTELSRHTSAEDHSQPSTPPEPEHTEFLDMESLSKVPSYATATRSPLPRTNSFPGMLSLPDYHTAVSSPVSPAVQTPSTQPPTPGAELMGTISEETVMPVSHRSHSSMPSPTSTGDSYIDRTPGQLGAVHCYQQTAAHYDCQAQPGSAKRPCVTTSGKSDSHVGEETWRRVRGITRFIATPR
jgi:hypothetical protein